MAAAADSSAKFIPTYFILYGNPKARPAEETAKFDLLVSSFSSRNANIGFRWT